MDEWIQLLKFAVKIGLTESGRAIWWIGIGEFFATLIGIFVLVIGWRITKRLHTETRYGVWCRRSLLASWLLLLTPIFASRGFLWGVNVAAVKTIVAQQLIENAFEESLAVPIDAGLIRLENRTARENAADASENRGGPGQDLGRDHENLHGTAARKDDQGSESPRLYSATKLLEDLDTMEAGPLKQTLENAANKLDFDSSIVPDWVLTWITHQALGIVKGENGPSLADTVDMFREVIADTEANDPDKDGMISARQLAWSVGSTQGLPLLQAYMSDTRRALVVLAALQVRLLIGITTLLFWLSTYLLDKLFLKRGNETPEPASDNG